MSTICRRNGLSLYGWMTGDAPASSRFTGGRSTGELHPPYGTKPVFSQLIVRLQRDSPKNSLKSSTGQANPPNRALLFALSA